MNSHEPFKKLSENQWGGIKKISPEFDGLTLDMQELLELSKNPAFLSALLFKLAQEREKTNKMLEKIYDKFDRIMLELKTKAASAAEQKAFESTARTYEVLPENDQMILTIVGEKGQVNAQEIKSALGYKGTNAASQRLNKLNKEGYLRKVQSGRKVLYYLAKN